jgi:putative endonuclease
MRAKWYVYIVQCSDGTLYTGVTTDVERRLYEHNNSKLASKYVRARRPAQLIYQRTMRNKVAAFQEEYRIKMLTKEAKLMLINKASIFCAPQCKSQASS